MLLVSWIVFVLSDFIKTIKKTLPFCLVFCLTATIILWRFRNLSNIVEKMWSHKAVKTKEMWSHKQECHRNSVKKVVFDGMVKQLGPIMMFHLYLCAGECAPICWSHQKMSVKRLVVTLDSVCPRPISTFCNFGRVDWNCWVNWVCNRGAYQFCTSWESVSPVGTEFSSTYV